MLGLCEGEQPVSLSTAKQNIPSSSLTEIEAAIRTAVDGYQRPALITDDRGEIRHSDAYDVVG